VKVSFVITVYVPEAIVLAADSRMFLGYTSGTGTQIQTPATDSNNKLFLLQKRDERGGQASRPVGVTTYGDAILVGRAIESHIKQFSYQSLAVTDDVLTVKDKLLAYMRGISTTVNLGFQVAGFRTEDGVEAEHVWVLDISGNASTRVNVQPGTTSPSFGANWAGEPDVMARLVNCAQVRQGTQLVSVTLFPVPFNIMTVQDAIDYALYAVRTTIDTMRFEARFKTVGGPIDCLLMTPESAEWVQHKRLQGELA
jgi:hypothetical protein